MKRSTREIKEDLRRDREALSANLDALLGRRKEDGPSRPSLVTEHRSVPPLWTLIAGAGMGFLLIRKPLWPLRVMGRLVGVAAPVLIPMVISYLRERRERDTAFAR